MAASTDRLPDVSPHKAAVAGAQAERQNVVKWLLSMAESAICNKTPEGIQLAKYLDDLADAIERGDHRAEVTE